SIEEEDVFLRLDKDLADFFQFLDSKVGRNNYTVFLTADHGVSHAVNFLAAHQIPGGLLGGRNIISELNGKLAGLFAEKDLILSGSNYYINFDMAKVRKSGRSIDQLKQVSIDYLRQQPGIQYVIDMSAILSTPVPAPLQEMIINGYNPRRCGQILIIPEPAWFEGSKQGTTHGVWGPQDTHIPLLFMGWGIQQGVSRRTVHMTDIAPTVAALLHIQMPDGCIGQPIGEVLK
ncbi:MAG TPA: alkaline phosphatase family protein, partial [Puia sp.]|nr:alkaline phosphatase family protein [Puia sp.]